LPISLGLNPFEAFFLPCIGLMAGRRLVGPGGGERGGLIASTTFEGDPETIRGVKEWLSTHMPSGRAYKPTIDQLALTRLIDFRVLRAAEPPLLLLD
jgi:hypothetical protein